MSDNSANKRIAKNTLLLYFRMMFMMVISLYTSRVILASLGIEDYGIYNVVGGFVGMFAIISGSLNAAINRFLTYEMGTGDDSNLKRVFSTAITIQVILSAIIVFLAETIGLWYVNNIMVVPADRLDAANWCYQFSIVTFVVSLLSVPYNSAIIAHERMSAFAYVSIFEAVGRLSIAFLINYNPFDRLIYYGILLAIFSFVVQYTYIRYCKRHFEETRFRFSFDKEMLSRMFSFAGWNFIGAGSRVLRDTGGNLLLNFYFGPTVNAARGISNSICHAVTQFSENFMTALNPQITKSYACNEREHMFTLIYTGARLSAFLMLFLSTPIILNTKFLLQIWLKEVPDHAALFAQLSIFYALSEIISYPLVTAMLATGNIRNYQIVVGGFQCLNIPVAWVLLQLGCIPETVVMVSIFVAHCCLASRLYMLRSMINLNAKSFFISVYCKVVVVMVLGYVLPFFTHLYTPDGWIDFFATSSVSVLSMSVVILYIGCTQSERVFVFAKAKQIINKFPR